MKKGKDIYTLFGMNKRKDKQQKEADKMKERNINKIWSAALLMIGVCAIFQGVFGMTDTEYKDIFIRVFGVSELLALPVLAFTTVLRVKNRQR